MLVRNDRKARKGIPMGKLTTVQAANRLGVTDRSVRNYIDRGLLPAEKVSVGLNWKYMIDVQNLEAFARENNIALRSEPDQ